MANPQLENGFTRIAHDILEALARTRIPGEARQVLDVILRKTYGYQKKADQIALSQFTLATGLKKPKVCRSISKLVSMNLISVTQKGNDGNLYTVNKDFEKWKSLPKKVTIITKKGNQTYPKKGTTIDTTKDKRYKKQKPAKKTPETFKTKLSPDMWQELFDCFKPINPAYDELFRNTTQRKALNYLVDKYSYDKMLNMLRALPEIVMRKAAPRISTPYELKMKLGHLLLFIRQSQDINNGKGKNIDIS